MGSVTKSWCGQFSLKINLKNGRNAKPAFAREFFKNPWLKPQIFVSASLSFLFLFILILGQSVLNLRSAYASPFTALLSGYDRDAEGTDEDEERTSQSRTEPDDDDDDNLEENDEDAELAEATHAHIQSQIKKKFPLLSDQEAAVATQEARWIFKVEPRLPLHEVDLKAYARTICKRRISQKNPTLSSQTIDQIHSIAIKLKAQYFLTSAEIAEESAVEVWIRKAADPKASRELAEQIAISKIRIHKNYTGQTRLDKKFPSLTLTQEEQVLSRIPRIRETASFMLPEQIEEAAVRAERIKMSHSSLSDEEAERQAIHQMKEQSESSKKRRGAAFRIMNPEAEHEGADDASDFNSEDENDADLIQVMTETFQQAVDDRYARQASQDKRVTEDRDGRKWDQTFYKKIKRPRGRENICPICKEKEFVRNMIEVSCKHRFHRECITGWATTAELQDPSSDAQDNHQVFQNRNCPVCLKKLVPISGG